MQQLSKIPNEVIHQIFYHLDSRDINNFCNFSKAISKKTNDNNFWKNFLDHGLLKSAENPKEFVLTRTIGSENELIQRIIYFIMNLKSIHKATFQCSFIKSDSTLSFDELTSPTVQISITPIKPNPDAISVHQNFYIRKEFIPSCISDSQTNYFTNLIIQSSYFPLSALPDQLDKIYERAKRLRIQLRQNGVASRNIDAKIKEAMPEDYALLGNLIENKSAEYHKMTEVIFEKLQKLDTAIV